MNKQEYSIIYRNEHKEEKRITDKLYREKHKDECALYRKAYYQEHKDEHSSYFQTYRDEHKEQLTSYFQKYREINKDAISLKTKEKMTCECGCIVRKKGLNEHKQSQKHKDLMETKLA